jgi:phosphoribosylformimino-5-aminoimidazole carboxamide ribonucleotide (ProFAR) isomerase
MHLYPAIDIKGGRVVRHAEGGPDTVYGLDPVAAAEAFLADGASWLHVVDLDRAFDAGRDNDGLLRRIVGLPGARVQVGGRLRGPDQVARVLELGAARAVVATGAMADPGVWERVAGAVDPSRLAVAVDVRQHGVVDRGSDQPLTLAPDALVRRAVAAGVRVVIHRDLLRDGELAGLELNGAARLMGLGADIVAAGGVGSTAHLAAARDAGLAGVIVGRALHEGLFTLREALACSV